MTGSITASPLCYLLHRCASKPDNSSVFFWLSVTCVIVCQCNCNLVPLFFSSGHILWSQRLPLNYQSDDGSCVFWKPRVWQRGVLFIRTGNRSMLSLWPEAILYTLPFSAWLVFSDIYLWFRVTSDTVPHFSASLGLVHWLKWQTKQPKPSGSRIHFQQP